MNLFSRLTGVALLAVAVLTPIGADAAGDKASIRAQKQEAKQREKAANLALKQRSAQLHEQFKEEAQDDPAGAEKFYLKKRLAPGMTALPVERLLEARDHARSMPLHAAATNSFISAPEGSRAAQSLTWTALGPGNIGGRTRVFKYVPGSITTIYSAGVAGGVWKSTDNGTTWTALGDAMANMAVESLAIDPTNTNIIYAGTGEGYFNIDAQRGAGIFKSIDGGVNWTQLANTAPPGVTTFTRVNDLAISPTVATTIYAATLRGLFRSTDSGANWTQLIVATTANGCQKIVFRTDVDTAIASCGTFAPTDASSGIWRSTAASGVTPAWTHIVGAAGSGATQTLAKMGRISLAIAPSLQTTMYALIACSYTSGTDCGSGNFDQGLLAVYKSTDGGATWSSAYTSTFNGNTPKDLLLTNPNAQLCQGSAGFNQGWYDNVIAVDPANAAKVYVGGIDLWRSDDSGATWGTISYWWLGGFAQFAHADQHGIFFHPNYNGTTETRVYATDDGGMFVSTDAATATRATTATNICPNLVSQIRGASWTSLNNGYGVTQYYHGTAYPTGTTYFAGAQDNGTTRGSDGSPNAWTSILGGDGGWTAIDKTSSGGTTVLYAETTGISIEKSTDNGANFASAISGISDTGCGQFINPFQIDPGTDLGDNQRLFTSSNVLWRTSNAAASWSQASAAIPGTSCTVPASDSGERIANFAIAPGNSDLLVVGTDNGQICRLTNATVSTSATALANCTTPAGAGSYVSGIGFDPTTNSKVYAAISTFGVGHVWQSTNSGQTWTNIDGSGVTALPDAPAHTVAVSPLDATGNTIYVGTDVGVYVTTDAGGNWARENTGFANVITDHLVFNTNASLVTELFAFTHGRGVFKTTVGGGLTATTTVLTSSINPTVFGQSTTLTATVTGGSTPTGTVTFKDGVTTINTAALNGSGVATLGVSTLSVGSHNLTAVYGGDASHAGSTSSIVVQVVNKANTATTITADTPDPSVFGATVPVNFTVVASLPGAGTPSGNVTITVSGGSETCTGTVAAGTCSLALTNLGARTLTATYAGDTNFNGSTDTEPHTVGKADTTTTITADTPDPSVFGASVPVNFTVVATAPGAGTPTGNVTITISGGAETCTGTVAAGTCSLALTNLGARTLTATYAGDTNFNGSTDTEPHTVGKANTTTTITADTPDPSVFGATVPVNFTVVATAPGAGTPTGNVTITISGGAETCTGTVAAGTCSLALTNLGARTLTATYAGDTNFNGSTDTEPHTVGKANTTTTITADNADPSLTGEAVAVNFSVAAVAPGAGTPTGTVTITVSGGAETCNATVAVGTCNITLTSAGARTLTATYAGDTNFNGSSDTEPHTIGKSDTTTTITSDNADPSVTGQAVTVNYSVLAVAPGSGTPSGNVVVTVSGGSETCTGTVAAGTCTITLNTAGSRTLTATYAGDSNYNGSSDTEAHVIGLANTTTTITADNADPSVVGEAVTVSYTVVANAPGSGTPSGNVTVTVSGGTETCTGTVAAGSCSIVLTGLGARTLTATYVGDANYNGSSDTEPHTVGKANTTTTITSDTPDPSVFGGAVPVNFSVVATAPGSGTPTGNVTITVSGGTETCTGTVAAGTCSLSLTTLGARTLTATYAGDSSYNGSTDTEPHTVGKANSTTTITADNADPSVSGEAVTVNFSVVATAPGSGTPTGTVTITVSGGAETCSATAAVGTCNITLIGTGARTLTATYAGDSNFNGSSDTEPHVVGKADSATTITSDLPDASVVGQAVTVNFSVAAAAPGSGTPTGTVTVTVSGGAETCSATAAVATCSITLTSSGARTLTATYAGDTNFNGSSDTETHTVNAASTSTTITSDLPDPSVVGQAVTVAYTVVATGAGSGTPTGNVVVTISGGAETCTGTVAGGSCAITLTSAGARTFTATYAGDGNFSGSSDTETHQVNAASTSTTITSDLPDPSVVGQSVTVAYTVVATGAGSGTPTGNVVVTISGGAETCTGTVAAGSCSISLTSSGARTLTATYAGDGNFSGSSDTETHQVNAASTSTTITSDLPDPSVVGQAVSVVYTVVPTGAGSGTPTGNVVVTVSGGAETCTGTVAAGGCSITLTSSGARTFTATYAGDGNFNGSSDTETHQVNAATTSTTINSDLPDPSVVGQAVTVAYSVVATGSGSGTPTGNVVVTVSGGAETCTGTVAAGSCSITLASSGARTLTATYAGDSNFGGSSDTETHQVNAASTSTTITSDLPDPSVVGQAVSVVYTVVATGAGSGTPTGNVVVTVSGGSETCTGTVAGGSCSITLTASGARTLTATYAGDSNFGGSSDTETHTVNVASTSSTITSDLPDPSVVGQSVTVAYTVVATGAGSGTPTGNVVVTVSGGAETCTGTVAAASCSITLTSSGARTFTATYAGDGNFSGSSDTETHQVNAASTSTTITSDLPDPSVVGQAVSVAYTVVATGAGSGTPTGNVVVTVSGGSETCTGTAAAGGCSITLTASGARTLTATYAGDGNFSGSSDTETHQVNAATTSTTITSDLPDPSVVGQAVSVVYTVVATGAGSGTPTGNVVVTVSGGAETCTGTVAAGSCSITLTSSGARTLTATYAGDSNFGGSSDTETHQVNAASTSTTITTDLPDPSVVGQAVSVAYTVVATGSGSGTPTGNVVVTISGGAETCTGTVAAGSCSITLTSAGARTFTATYAGNSNFGGSSDTETHQVNAASTSTTITSDLPDPSVVGQAVTVAYSVVATGAGSGTPTGNVVVTVSGGAETCTGTIAAGGCSITLTSSGARTFTATYAGDGNFSGSSDIETHAVNAASTSTTITTDLPDPSVVGQAVTVAYTVVATGAGSGTPTGNVVVTVSGGSETCTGTVAAGSCSITLTSSGARTLTATYAGNANFSGSSDTETHTVNQAATLTTITSDTPEPSAIGQAVTVNFTVAAVSPGSGTPTGTVTVTASGGVETCTASVAVGTCTITLLGSGSRTLTATYAGDANFSGSNDTEPHTVSGLSADLSISKTDNRTNAVITKTVSYTIVVSNAGPDTAIGANVTDTVPAALTGATWTCTSAPASLCTNASGSGSINELVTLASGQTVTYTLTGTVGGSVGGTLSNTASVAAPAGITDGNNTNNSATDSDPIVADDLFSDGFE